MKNIAVVFGGKSPEHEISVRSARNIMNAIDTTQFRIIQLGIDRQGIWRLSDLKPDEKYVSETGPALGFVPGKKDPVYRLDNQEPIEQIDLMYLVLHGPNGEDGTVQGMMRLLDLPFIGPDVLGSSAAMDKEFTKRLLAEAGVQVAPGMTAYHYQQDSLDYDTITTQFGSPHFYQTSQYGILGRCA